MRVLLFLFRLALSVLNCFNFKLLLFLFALKELLDFVCVEDLQDFVSRVHTVFVCVDNFGYRVHILFFDRNLQSIHQVNDVVLEALESNGISFVNVIFQKNSHNG